MKFKFRLTALTFVLMSITAATHSQPTLSRETNPYIGTDGQNEQSTFFSHLGAGVGFVENGKIDVEANIYKLRVYGPNGSVAGEFNFSTRVVDGLGNSLRSVREYIFSKKGSPITINKDLNFTSWVYGKPKNPQQPAFWLAGRTYFDAKLYPIDKDISPDIVNGSFSMGYTQQVNIDLGFTADSTEHLVKIFAEGSIIGNVLIGRGLLLSVYEINGKKPSALVSGDYTVGVYLDKKATSTISISGNLSVTNISGFRSGFQITYAQELKSLF